MHMLIKHKPSTMTSSISAAKQHLRSAVKKRLASLSPESISTQSLHIFEALQHFQPYRDANRISIYLSMPSSEVQTDAIVRHALRQGKQVFVPYLHKPTSTMTMVDDEYVPKRLMDMVLLRSVEDFETLKRDSWGIPSIDPATVHERERILDGCNSEDSSAAAGLDLMLVPGVAFGLEESGRVRRLGHGKGFYDFFLNRYFVARTPGLVPESVGDEAYDKKSGLVLCGLAFEEQLLSGEEKETIPMDKYDRRLDGLILGNGDIKGGLGRV